MESRQLITMQKEDWIRLATPASIMLLAAAIFMQPLMSNAFPSSISVTQAWGETWDMKCQ